MARKRGVPADLCHGSLPGSFAQELFLRPRQAGLFCPASAQACCGAESGGAQYFLVNFRNIQFQGVSAGASSRRPVASPLFSRNSISFPVAKKIMNREITVIGRSCKRKRATSNGQKQACKARLCAMFHNLSKWRFSNVQAFAGHRPLRHFSMPAWPGRPRRARPRSFYPRDQLKKWDREKVAGGKARFTGSFPIPATTPQKDWAIKEIGWMRLQPGASIGMHKHEANEDTYIIVSGEGVFTDTEGRETPVKAGDITIARKGDSHALKNTGAEPLIFLDIIGQQ